MTILTKSQIDELHPARLKDLAKRGIVRVVTTTSIKSLKYTELPEYRKHANFKGVRITASEAARVFGIHQVTISRWGARGLLTILERTDREIYFDKADVAYCAEIYRQKKGSGRWLFNPDRTPYTTMTR